MDDIFKRAPHTPAHLFRANATYTLTACIYGRTPLLTPPSRKAELRDAFKHAANNYSWDVIAWVILDDHYHFMVQAGDDATNLPKFTSSYHKFTARRWNEEDNAVGRKVWWNYWDSCIRSESDSNHRLRYIFLNPVKHGLVQAPEDYPFSNYTEFLARNESRTIQKSTIAVAKLEP